MARARKCKAALFDFSSTLLKRRNVPSSIHADFGPAKLEFQIDRAIAARRNPSPSDPRCALPIADEVPG
jgi:hypothetical protein